MQSTLRPRGSGVTAATPDLGFGAFGRGGSTPPSRTQLSPPVQCGSGRTPGTRRLPGPTQSRESRPRPGRYGRKGLPAGNFATQAAAVTVKPKTWGSTTMLPLDATSGLTATAVSQTQLLVTALPLPAYWVPV